MDQIKALLILCVLEFGFEITTVSNFKVPFRPKDLLHVLPVEISWPVLNGLGGSAVDLLPTYVGSVSPYNGTVEWKGACFFGSEASLEFSEGDRVLGGGVLHLKVRVCREKTTGHVYAMKKLKRELIMPESYGSKVLGASFLAMVLLWFSKVLGASFNIKL